VSDGLVERASRSRSSASVRLVSVVAAILLVLVATALYLRVGWSRLESACSLDEAQGQIRSSVSYGWSWQPLGFQCTYDNGQTSTSLWP
jgi:hypothetical protein